MGIYIARAILLPTVNQIPRDKKMKIIFWILVLTNGASANEITNYKCPYRKDTVVILSFLDRNNPSVTMHYKNNAFAYCLYENTPSSSTTLPYAQVQERVWQLQLKKCEYYNENKKNQFKFLDLVTFKQAADKKSGYFQILKEVQPLYCTASM